MEILGGTDIHARDSLTLKTGRREKEVKGGWWGVYSIEAVFLDTYPNKYSYLQALLYMCGVL